MTKGELIEAIYKYDDFDEIVVNDCGYISDIIDIEYSEFNGIKLCI